jgi:CheY-like chemotaxis protein
LRTAKGERRLSLDVTQQREGEQTQRASHLIQQILDFSRRSVLERGPLDLATFLKGQVKLLRHTLPEHIQIDLTYNDENAYIINADPTRLQQAVINLATNARDAMPEGGHLHFDLKRVAFRNSETLIQGQGRTLLVVEDEAITRKALVDSLEGLNYRVLEAVNGRQALEIFEQHTGTINLVSSDAVMPEMGGQALVHALQERNSTAPVVLLTSHPLKEQEFESLLTKGLRAWSLNPPTLSSP